MNLFERVDRFGGRMKWYDFSLIKSVTFFFSLFMIAAWPQFRDLVLSIHWGWFLGISLVAAIPVLRKF